LALLEALVSLKIKFPVIMTFILVFFFVFASNACAYLDPGTGSYILQLLIAGIASAVLAVKIFWEKIIVFFRKVFGKKDGSGK
jgi:hypothetical protein